MLLLYFYSSTRLGQKYQAPQVRPYRGSNSWPPDHNSTFHATEMSALPTWPSVTSKRNVLLHYLRRLRWFQMHGLSDRLMHWQLIFWFKYDLGLKYQAPQVRPDWNANSWPPDHDNTFYVTEMPALTAWPSVTSIWVGWKHCAKVNTRSKNNSRSTICKVHSIHLNPILRANNHIVVHKQNTVTAEHHYMD